MKREGTCTDFESQTALHVAIVQSNFKAVEMLLKYANSTNKKEKLLQISANGKQFKNTVLMGQLPLSVAALMMKKQDCLDTERFKTGASLWEKNSLGDTVFHSLIKYGDVYHEKILHVKAAFSYVWQRFRDEALKSPDNSPFITDILFWENNEGLTPLQLSAKLGVGEVFDYIINLSNVYCFQNVQDGLFDIRVYDVTEFDRLIQYLEEQENSEMNFEKSANAAIKKQDKSKRSSGNNVKQKSEPDKAKKKPGKITIVERLFDPQCTQREVFEILNQKLVRYILQKKWNTYWIPLSIWLITHFFFMLFTTVVTMRKSDVLICSKENQTSCELGESGDAVGFMFLLIGLVYLAFSSLLIHKLVVRLYNGGLGLLRHNLDYIVCLTVVSIGAIFESILSFLRLHWDFHLVCLLIFGWYFMLYFSPFHKNIVSFTYMMKSGLVEDFIPFSLSFLLLLMSFTTAMHVLFRGIDEHPEEFDSFRDSLLTMFKLGVGLNDISVLNQSRIPWLAYTLFILFAILSFIHLLNALIAIMSQTFSDFHQERKSHLNYQKLCMIEFF
ncbi:transient receptor potential cation channel subfamily V member 3-like [Saccostrea cucullata]|uniref:transient receptor potential cation channel subfamily V member 3-like n=1 Tax=Saccostrea cuccullata TaxID=36930 RepID=UPI002ED3ED24